MNIFLALVSAVALATAESPVQGGYSGGGGSFPAGGGSFNFGNGGYTTGFGASGGESYGAPVAAGYSSGSSSGGGFNGASGSGGGFNGGAASGGAPEQSQGPQTFKYVSVHSAPVDPEDQATKQVRVPGGGNKHVNIIFVKAPSNGADQKTEVILPEQDEQKNLVYVLVQKSDVAANLKIQRPQPTKPAKPEVYFIRYKNDGGAGGIGGANGGAGSGGIGGGDFRGTSGPASVPSAAYGAP